MDAHCSDNGKCPEESEITSQRDCLRCVCPVVRDGNPLSRSVVGCAPSIPMALSRWDGCDPREARVAGELIVTLASFLTSSLNPPLGTDDLLGQNIALELGETCMLRG